VKITAYPQGMPCWIDLATPDLDASRGFYTELLGWTPHSSPDPSYGGYTIFHLGDDPVAGAGPLMMPEQPPAWSWYAATTDADAMVGRVEEAGGKVLSAPMDIGSTGRMAMFLDVSGAPFAVWQPKDFVGARVVGQPGSLGWTELMTREPQVAIDFYGKVLGWTVKPGSGDPRESYTEFQIDGRSVAGMMPMDDDRYPADLPDHWMIYFCVTDTDATAERVKELGGNVSIPPRDTPAGRYAVAVDPGGAWFSMISALPST
jgi:uncharacterized protein